MHGDTWQGGQCHVARRSMVTTGRSEWGLGRLWLCSGPFGHCVCCGPLGHCMCCGPLCAVMALWHCVCVSPSLLELPDEILQVTECPPIAAIYEPLQAQRLIQPHHASHSFGHRASLG